MPRALLVLLLRRGVQLVRWRCRVAAAPDPPAYLPPVDAPVLDPFRPPASPFGPGNRGLEYATTAGTPVHAVADGRVTFAGSVAGTLHVTVLHADGVRTSYSFLARVDVVVGQRLRQGEPWSAPRPARCTSARAAATPTSTRASLFDGRATAGAPGAVRRTTRRRAVRASAVRSASSSAGVGGLVESAGGAVGSVAGWLRDGGDQLLRTMDHYASRFTFPTAMLDASFTMAQAWQRARSAADRPCSGAGGPAAGAAGAARRGARRGARIAQPRVHRRPGRHGRAGLRARPTSCGSATRAAVSPTTPTRSRRSPALPTRRTPPRPTSGSPAPASPTSSSRSTAAAPGVPIDLYAHSQGGVVARLALIELERRHGVEWLRRVGLAGHAGHAARWRRPRHRRPRHLEHRRRRVARSMPWAPPRAPSSTPSHPRSASSARPPTWWPSSPSTPCRRVVPAVSIAARGDVIVPVPRSVAPGMAEVVLPLARPVRPQRPARQPGRRRASWRWPWPGCRRGASRSGSALLDQGVGEGISLVEDLAGALGFLAAARADVRSP